MPPRAAAAPAKGVIDLLTAYPPGAAVLRGPSGPLSVEQLAAWARALDAALPPGPVLIGCTQRESFAAAALAALEGGRLILLPPTLKDEAMAELAAREGASLLVDRDDAPGSLDPRRLRPCAPAAPAARPTLGLEEPALVFYTSGSTGEPSAHQKRLGQLWREAQMQAARLGLGPDDCVLATVPAHHVYGFLFSFLVPLAAGASVVAEAPVAPAALAQEALAHGATVLVSVPTHLRAIAGLAGDALEGRLRHLLSSGAPLDAADAARVAAALRCAPEEILGSTETGGVATRVYPARAYTPLPGVEVSEREGLLCVRSPFVGGTGFWETADAIQLIDGGRFLHEGRVDDVVKIGGKRVSVGAVEAALCRLPGVADAVVRPTLAEGRGARLVAFVVPADGAAPAPAALRAALIRQLEDVAVPRAIHLVPAISRSSAGKVSAATLEALFAGHQGAEQVAE